ncbi:hypothetical protein DFH06DRAFT_1129647 [Mycena polygramma]|nr:hypothetical protein DFH06DRAFT_1129647 [Mycena polygramma]
MGKTKTKTSKAAQKAKKKAAQSTSVLQDAHTAASTTTYLAPPTRPPDRARSVSISATAGSSEPASFYYPDSSALPSLTPSASGPPGNAESVTEQYLRSSGSIGSKGSKDGSGRSSRHSSQRTAQGMQGVSFVQQVIPPTPEEQQRELPRTSSQGSRSRHGSTTGSTRSGGLSETARAQRKAEKGRRNRADSIESAELREAAARSLKDQQASAGATEDEEARPHVWDDENIRAAHAALARERQEHEKSEEFRKRHAAFMRNEQLLKSLRVEEDRQYAADVQAQIAQMDADRELAEELSQNNISLERRRARLQQAQLAMAEEAAAIEAIDSRRKEVAESLCSAEEVLAEYVARHKSRQAKVVTVDSDTDTSESNTLEYLKHSSGIRKTHTFADRVTIQRYRLAELAQNGESGIPDQGISWDAAGKAYETHPARSRGSSVGTLGGKHRKSGASRVRVEKSTAGRPVGSSPLSSLGRAVAESSRVPGRPSERAESGIPKGSHYRERTSAARQTKEEGGDSKENLRSSKDRHGPATNDDGGSSSGSSGSDDGNSSDGSSADDSTSQGSYREGSTDEDSDENSDSAWDQTPEEVISEISAKKEEGNSSRFTAAAGAGGAPSDHSSSSSSEDEHKHRPSKGPSKTPRKNPAESERRPVNYEWQQSVSKRYTAVRERESGTTTKSSPQSTRTREEPSKDNREARRDTRESASSSRRDDGKRRGFRFVKRESGEENKSPTVVRDGGERTKNSFASKSSAPTRGTVKKTVECYKCGGPHYKDKCPQNDKPKLFAQREVVDDNSDADDEDDERSSSEQKKASKAPSEQLREAHEEEEGPESSDGGYTLQEFSEYSLSDNDERCGAMWSRDMPELLDYDSDDSDGEAESELLPSSGGSNNDDLYIRPRKRRHHHGGVFETCEEWPAEEFVDDKDIDRLAREMAENIRWRNSCLQQETGGR